MRFCYLVIGKGEGGGVNNFLFYIKEVNKILDYVKNNL